MKAKHAFQQQIVRIAAMALALALITGLIPLTDVRVYAARGKAPAMQPVRGGKVSGIRGKQVSKVYFGKYKQTKKKKGGYKTEPIKWRVLRNSDGRLFLLSDRLLDYRKYHNRCTAVTWETCTLRHWLNGTGSCSKNNFMKTAFASGEKAAVAGTKVASPANPDFGTPGGKKTTDRVFLLSVKEATSPASGFPRNYKSTRKRRAKITGYAFTKALFRDVSTGDWWLRTPGGDSRSAALIYDYGDVYSDGYDADSEGVAVRPAFNLNLKSVLFTSAAVNGKSSGAAGTKALKDQSNKTNSSNEWKMTVKDSAHANFAVDSAKITFSRKTGLVKVPYSGASTKKNNYISAIITDKPVTNKKAKIRYYGRIARASSAKGASVRISTAGKLESGDKLYVFNEQYNGNKKTDYASKLIRIKFPAPDKNGNGILLPRMTAKGRRTLVLSWNKINGADGYDVFFGRCGKKLKKAKTIKGNRTFRWTKKGLKKKTAYKASVRAYQMKNGKKSFVRTSLKVHAYTSGGKRKYTNAISVTVKKSVVSLKKGKTYKIRAKVKKLRKGKKLMPSNHTRKLRYLSSSKKIAAVDRSGRITAKARGSCRIYAIAVNGAWKAIKVTVK